MKELRVWQRLRFKVVLAAIAVFVFSGLPTSVQAADLIFYRSGTPTRYGDWATSAPVENLSLDINGDGLRDLVRIYRSETGRALADILLSNGEAFYRSSGVASADLGSWQDGTVPVKYLALDANGDGREDIGRFWRSSTGRMMVEPFLSSGVTLFRLAGVAQDIGPWAMNGRSVKIVPMRVDPDAQTDLVLLERSASGKTMQRTLHGFGFGRFACTAVLCPLPLDIGDWAINNIDVATLSLDTDGDKQEDLVRIANVGGQALVDILHSHGNGFHRRSDHATQTVGPWSGNDMIAQHLPMDIDRDGKVDLLRITKSAGVVSNLQAEGLYSDGRSFSRVAGGGSAGYVTAANNWALNATKPLNGRPTLFRLTKIDNHFLATMDYVDKLSFDDFRDRLITNQRLESGHYLSSPNKKYRLTLRKDGNLVLADVAERILWQSNTAGKGATFLVLQSDGNLVLYGPAGPVWSSATGDYPIVAFVVRDDGQFALQKTDGTPLWLSRDHAPQPNARITTTVMAYNIADHVTDGHANLVADTIRDAGVPDIVLLNEVRDEYFHRSQSDVVADRVGYPYRYYHATTKTGLRGTKGMAILSKYPLNDRRYWDIPKPDWCASNGVLTPKVWLCDYNFGIMRATVTIRGVAHDIYSLRFSPQHPTSSDAFRMMETPSNRNGHKLAMDLIKATPTGRPIIMGGDFNAEWKNSPWTKDFRDQSGLRDAYVDFDRHNPTRLYNGRVDYVYYRGPFVLKNAVMKCGRPDCGDGSSELFASDHEYVLITFAQPGS